MKTIITVNNLRIYAFHGVLDQEHSVGNEYRIDCSIEADVSRAMQTDQVTDTISYAEVIELIQREMHQPSALLEHVAGRIISALQQRWPDIAHIDLNLSKVKPPVAGADVESCSFRVII
ncbi:MAG: dihydroneopterin aldolase [Bacteroidales bacterium]|nr:dihydroneopterin aldolase [Bacteroidales bacterium]